MVTNAHKGSTSPNSYEPKLSHKVIPSRPAWLSMDVEDTWIKVPLKECTALVTEYGQAR